MSLSHWLEKDVFNSRWELTQRDPQMDKVLPVRDVGTPIPFPKSLDNYIEGRGQKYCQNQKGKDDKKEKVSSTHNSTVT